MKKDKNNETFTISTEVDLINETFSITIESKLKPIKDSEIAKNVIIDAVKTSIEKISKQ